MAKGYNRSWGHATDIDPRAPYLKKGRTVRVTGFSNQYGSTYEVDPVSAGAEVPHESKTR